MPIRETLAARRKHLEKARRSTTAHQRKAERERFKDTLEGRAEARAAEDHAYPNWCVYFLYCDELRLVKIGHSRDLKSRVADIRSCSPVDMRPLGWVPGGIAIERALHERLCTSRARGEWFRLTEEVLATLASFGIADPLFD